MVPVPKAVPPRPPLAAKPAEPLRLESLPAEILAELRGPCQLPDPLIREILAAVQQGVRTPAQFLGITPAVANTFEAMALGFYRHQHYAQAASLYAFLLELDVKRATAWRGLGACNQATKLYPIALFCYQNALQISPEDFVSQVLCGEVLCLMQQDRYGIEVLQDALNSPGAAAAQPIYRQRAAAILRAKLGSPKGAAEGTADGAAAAPSATAAAPAAAAGLEAGFVAGGDDRDAFQEPHMQQLLATLTAGVQREQITIKDVAGFTDEQLHGGYVAACRYLDIGQPVTSLQIIGWLIYLDARNPRYYHVAGLAAQHLKLWCLADYLYGLSLIYGRGKPNPITLIYRGEAKIFSQERHAGLDLLRQGLASCGSDAEEQDAARRAQQLLQQFGAKQDRDPNRPAP